jgi:hypothetical protein
VTSESRACTPQALLRRLYVLFFSRARYPEGLLFACDRQPGADWVTQRARNLSLVLSERRPVARFLVRDRAMALTKSSHGRLLLLGGTQKPVHNAAT